MNPSYIIEMPVTVSFKLGNQLFPDCRIRDTRIREEPDLSSPPWKMKIQLKTEDSLFKLSNFAVDLKHRITVRNHFQSNCRNFQITR